MESRKVFSREFDNRVYGFETIKREELEFCEIKRKSPRNEKLPKHFYNITVSVKEQ